MSRNIVSGLAAAALACLAGSSQAALHPAGPAAPPSAAATPARAGRPSASSSVTAIRVVVPGGRGAASPQPPAQGASSLPSFAFPADGAVVISGAASGTRSESLGAVASASGASRVVNVSIFDGEITASSVAAAARSTANARAATGALGSVAVAGLQVLGQQVTRGRVALADWGYLTVGRASGGRVRREGASSYSGSVIGLDVSLIQAHGGLPAGSEVEIAVAGAAAAVPPPAPPAAPVLSGPLPGDRPQLLPPTSGPLLGVPQVIQPTLGPGPYVLPVFGRSALADDYGALAPAGGFAHGVVLSGQLGQPLVAVADGTLFGVGWSRAAGNRLRLRDRQGNDFYYAHLSAFSASTAEGARVREGEVLGFMGTSGNAQGRRPELEFEVHPVSLLFLGAQGAVDPAPYLATWRGVQSIALSSGPAWAPSVPGTANAPEPGAALVSSSDISSVGQVGPSTLRRSFGAQGRRG